MHRVHICMIILEQQTTKKVLRIQIIKKKENKVNQSFERLKPKVTCDLSVKLLARVSIGCSSEAGISEDTSDDLLGELFQLSASAIAVAESELCLCIRGDLLPPRIPALGV